MAERRPSWWSFAATAGVAVLSSALTVGLLVGIQRRNAEQEAATRAEQDRRWCALLTTLDEAYGTPPGPSTQLGRKVAEEIHRLRVGFGCPAGPGN